MLAQESSLSAPFVELSDVKLMFGEADGTMALDGLSMTVGKGEFVSVVGPSGCGKSSLMKLVTGLLPCSAGTIRVAGDVVRDPLHIVGMAFQNPTLLPWRSTLRNVLLPTEVSRMKRRKRFGNREADVRKAKNLLALVGLEDFADKNPWALSGGMQQRVNLCRSLIHDPELLMLDEPFGALDAFTREELWGLLQRLWQEHDFTCILVTHDLREAVYLSDRVFVMGPRPGRVIAEHRIDFPRPRSLDITFEPEFAKLVKTIRHQIDRPHGAVGEVK
ncbi:ABC transporter ATP-binding protein [Amorphus sp. 3PC139-8]|uniref:ABC transporter ATP-binding protein n=1 Tax=Amorphus sp. 3PC139-8 TaxID=2735676 RepID=UPI00345D4AB7